MTDIKTLPQSAAPAHPDHLEVLPLARLGMDDEALLVDFTHYFGRTLGRRTLRHGTPFPYQALVYAVRDRLMERWNRTNIVVEQNGRRAFYLSMEYLLGRLLNNMLLNLELQQPARGAMHRVGLELEELLDSEHDAGLGNGGLGRLAACFLDSCATLGLPVVGYGLRYRFGMFRQIIRDGRQVEKPDAWLREGFPWEIPRPDRTRTVRFGGRTAWTDGGGRRHYQWVETEDVLAIPCDVPIPGYRNDVVNTLRLWSSAATDEFNLEEFNAGDYADAMASKNEAENISQVLYPNDATESGRELRLKQQYFLASASLQDVIADWTARFGADFTEFSANHCFQLNDTHPAVAVAELMRLLMDTHRLEWDEAWTITTQTMAYTNHTLLPEALETWPVSLFRRLLPRVLDIIVEINRRFLVEVQERWPDDPYRADRMSLITGGDYPLVRMSFLAIVGSFSVNGVAELHSRLLREGLFRDFAELWPERFNNKTNGVTQRRWLAACNPRLAELISERIGDGWVTDLGQLEALRPFADDPELHTTWRAIKQANKADLAAQLQRHTGVEVDPAMLFDVQVKRIHEYKRQLLNVLHAIHLYDRLDRGEGEELLPRAIIIGGKAAPGYRMAKDIIQLVNDVATVIATDPATAGRLSLVFYPDYNVSAMEAICPAADLSAQISTAGKEASGTGNMKFMMNGALTIGTLDGANVEIREAVGEDNFFLFGLTVDEVAALRPRYDPASIIREDPDLARVLDLLEGGRFGDPGAHGALAQAVRSAHDPWMTAADFRGFVEAQQQVEAAYADPAHWSRMSILNTAASGYFSTDRTMRDYNRDIWRLDPVTPEAE